MWFAACVDDPPVASDAGTDSAEGGEPRSFCVGGGCVCLDGYDTCGGAAMCATTLRDNPLHCGRCDDRCFDGERCAGSSCVPVGCAPGFVDCENPGTPCETDLEASDRHCGACGNTCAAGTHCVTGRCASLAVGLQMPGSMLVATSARPWFRWRLGPGYDGARLQVCADATCARRELDVDVAGERYRPDVALGEGVHFWRVFARRGATVEATPSASWAFGVPAAGSVGFADHRPLLDLDGDGVVDEVSEATPSRFQVRFGVRSGGEARPTVVAFGSIPLVELRNKSVVPAGDLNGDGLGDALIAVNYNQRISPIESNGGVMFLTLLGSRVGAPRLIRGGSVMGQGQPGPGLVSARALGNAPGFSGLLMLVGRYGVTCSASLFQYPAPGENLGDWPCGYGPETSGDYNADGRVEVVTNWGPAFGSRPGEKAPMLRVCDGVPPLSPGDSRRSVVTADVDADGYDDLVVRPGGTGPRYVLHGGEGMLDGARCSTMP